LKKYKAAWVLPIAGPPVPDGWVAIDKGHVAAVAGSGSEEPGSGHASAVDLGDAAILPGLVNAHTHLELSYLRDEVPPAPEFLTWIRRIVAARRTRSADASDISTSVERAIEEARASGTAVVGDISNTLVSFEPLVRSRLAAVVFYELIRFSHDDPTEFMNEALGRIRSLPGAGRVKVSLAAHAPYSVAPAVFRAIREGAEQNRFAPCSVHLSESAEEVEFIKSGTGPWRTFLEELGVWDSQFAVPGVTPVEYLDQGGFLGNRLLAVHGVQMSVDDLARLAARGTTLVTCPRSNGHTGAGAPPLEDFYASGVPVAIGTDSLASAPDLNVFAELATMRALAPSVPASALLRSATLEGARALGFEADYGTIEPGKSGCLLAVDIPPGTVDVEEYLVSGVQPAQLRWIE